MKLTGDTLANTVSIAGLTLSVAQIETTLTILALLTAIILNVINITKKIKEKR